MQKTQVRSLGWEDPLGKEMATHSSIPAWEIPWTVEPSRLPSMGSQRVGPNWAQHSSTGGLNNWNWLFHSSRVWKSKITMLRGFIYFFFDFFFFSWRLFTLQYCSGSCHTLTRISHGFTCIPHPNPPSHFPLHSFPLGFPSAPGPSTCLMHPTWAGDLFHPR